MRALLVSDLHYELRKLDWVLAEAADIDLLVVAGDLLDIGSPVPLDTQITVVLEYLERCADRAPTVVCSGNHDLDRRSASGEKVTGWLADARAVGLVQRAQGRRVRQEGAKESRSGCVGRAGTVSFAERGLL